jgi:uncharacterized protein (DUF1330 family)
MNTFFKIAVVLLFAALTGTALAQEMAHGYILVTGWYKDAGAQREYNKAVVPILKANGYEKSVLGLSGSNMRVLEGDWIPGHMMLLIKFPSETQAKAFWWSREYQAARKIRQAASRLDIVQLDGVPGIAPAMTPASAYLVFVGETQDMQRFVTDYGQHAPKVVKEHGGIYVVRNGRPGMELLEGSHPPGSIVILEFTDTDALRAFWNSEAYQRLSSIRRETGKWSVVEIVPHPR